MLRLLLAALLLVTTSALAEDLSSLKSNKVLIQDVQSRLAERGFAVGTPDGALGGKTTKAFAKFAAEAGVADAPLDQQLVALGIDMTALDHLELKLDGPYLQIDNGLASGIERLDSNYDWKSFDIGRYRVTDDGIEQFTLDEAYCDHFAPENSDCDTKRARVQVRDASEPSAANVVYSFDFRVDSPPPAEMENIQFAELTQQGGIKAKHPETGKPVNFSPRFTLEIQRGMLTIQDNSLVDVSLAGGQLIKESSVPMVVGQWVHFDLEARWSPDEDGLFRFWVDGKPIWERTGRNATCAPDKSGKCMLLLKYGPYSSHYEGPSYVDNPVKFSFRNMHKYSSADEAATLLASLPTDFVVKTVREGGATEATDLTVVEQNSGDPNNPSHINSHLHVVIAGAADGKNEVDFNIQGDFLVAKEQFLKMQIVLNPPLGKSRPKGLDDCKGERTTVYDDGKHRAVIPFSQLPSGWTVNGADCYLAGLPEEARFMLTFIQKHFKDIAADMVASGNIGTVRVEPYRHWLQKVASGEVVVH